MLSDSETESEPESSQFHQLSSTWDPSLDVDQSHEEEPVVEGTPRSAKAAIDTLRNMATFDLRRVSVSLQRTQQPSHVQMPGSRPPCQNLAGIQHHSRFLEESHPENARHRRCICAPGRIFRAGYALCSLFAMHQRVLSLPCCSTDLVHILAIRLSNSFPLNGCGRTSSRHRGLNHRVLGGCYIGEYGRGGRRTSVRPQDSHRRFGRCCKEALR